MTLATIFVNPIMLKGDIWTLALLLPLCVSVAVIYKTVRVKELRRLPVEIAGVLAYITAGLVVLGLVLYLGYRLLA